MLARKLECVLTLPRILKALTSPNRIVLRAMSPIAQRQPSERSPPASSSSLAKEGPKTIDELAAAAMQHLSISGFRIADGSDVRADPTNGEVLSLLTAPQAAELALSDPSPFVKANAKAKSNVSSS